VFEKKKNICTYPRPATERSQMLGLNSVGGASRNWNVAPAGKASKAKETYQSKQTPVEITINVSLLCFRWGIGWRLGNRRSIGGYKEGDGSKRKSGVLDCHLVLLP
jgi:hypothetical protein